MQSNNSQNHELSRGKSRPCIQCSYKYGCCKKCDLCLKCHQKKYGTPHQVASRDYSLEVRQIAKKIARINPGNLEPLDLSELFDWY